VRVGVTLYVQNYRDWDRYEARERGESVPPLEPNTDAQIWQEEIETGLLVEDLGFDSLWTIEHHISPYTMVTNPVQLLTFFAGATKRIDVGTMVVVLPWHHPLRVAEDITMLQFALQGRTPFIGFGRGAARREFGQLGFDMNESRDRFAEGVEVIKRALTEEQFSFHGEHYTFENVTMRPRPRDPQQLLDNLHFSWGSPASAPLGASYGLKPLIIPQRPWAEYHADLEAFSKARAETGRAPARPRIHMNVFVGETEQEAFEGASAWIPEYTDSAKRNYEIGGNHFANIRGYEHYAQQAQAMATVADPAKAMAEGYLANHCWGTPDQCIEKLRQISDAFHPEEYMLVFRYGGMPKDVGEKSLQLFAKEVLPAVQEIPLEDPIVYEAAAV
jgi:alkanesulfonate monooxygenase SsuD/methylene tetrahydromethanopterin reductase-like flavin-dependent oxidoreductase (luciferase family)